MLLLMFLLLLWWFCSCGWYCLHLYRKPVISCYLVLWASIFRLLQLPGRQPCRQPSSARPRVSGLGNKLSFKARFIDCRSFADNLRARGREFKAWGTNCRAKLGWSILDLESLWFCHFLGFPFLSFCSFRRFLQCLAGFWPFGASFPFILAWWAFISFHFGHLRCHFLSFWLFGSSFPFILLSWRWNFQKFLCNGGS